MRLIHYDLRRYTRIIKCVQRDITLSTPATLSPEGKRELDINTTLYPDGFYFAIVTGTDVLGNTGDTIVPFSIRNWACTELWPASESSKGGRTMPVKFSLRVVAAVDPAMSFVVNDMDDVKLYRKVKV